MSDRDSLRGVPFRLSKKFYPLSRPQFRDIDIHIPLDALEEEYDFSLENQMIVKHDAFLEEKERLRIKNEERLAKEKRRQEELAAAAAAEAAAQAERLAQLLIEQAKIEAPAIINNEAGESSPEDQSEKPQSDGEEKAEPLPIPNQAVIHQVIPTVPTHQEPLPFSIPKSVTEKQVSTGGAKPQSTQRKVNVSLSDFEADTANPFDSVELKSMNDKAELASIWGKVLQDQQSQAYRGIHANRSSPASVTSYPTQQMQAPPWENHVGVGRPNGSLYYQPVAMAPSCSPVPAPPMISNSLNVRPISNQVLSSPTPTIQSSLGTSNAMPSSQSNSSAASVSSSNSFTKLHFPFLSSYTQANTRDRELERALERSYHEHIHQQQQQHISSSAPHSAVPGNVGFSPAMMHQPSLSSSTSASNLQNIPNNYNTTAAGVNSSHNLQNQAHNNFVIGHNYNWPLTTTHTPPYEYSQLQQPTKK